MRTYYQQIFFVALLTIFSSCAASSPKLTPNIQKELLSTLSAKRNNVFLTQALWASVLIIFILKFESIFSLIKQLMRQFQAKDSSSQTEHRLAALKKELESSQKTLELMNSKVISFSALPQNKSIFLDQLNSQTRFLLAVLLPWAGTIAIVILICQKFRNVPLIKQVVDGFFWVDKLVDTGPLDVHTNDITEARNILEEFAKIKDQISDEVKQLVKEQFKVLDDRITEFNKKLDPTDFIILSEKVEKDREKFIAQTQEFMSTLSDISNVAVSIKNLEERVKTLEQNKILQQNPTPPKTVLPSWLRFNN